MHIFRLIFCIILLGGGAVIQANPEQPVSDEAISANLEAKVDALLRATEALVSAQAAQMSVERKEITASISTAESSETPAASEDNGDEDYLDREKLNLRHWMDRWGVDERWSRVLNETIFGFTIGNLLSSFIILLVTLVFRNVITKGLFNRLRKFTKSTRFKLDDAVVEALEKPVSYFILAFGVFLSVIALPMEPTTENYVIAVYRGVGTLLFFWGLMRVADVLTANLRMVIKDPNSALIGFVPLIQKAVRYFILVIGILMVIDNLGGNIAAIIASLGIGGAAVALASRDTIANMFGSLNIVLDRPFKVGDWIQVGNSIDGTVEAIGLRSTRVRLFTRTLLSVPNNVLANETVINWSAMPMRRIRAEIGVTYETTADQMEEICEDIRELLRNDPAIHQSFHMVNFTGFGDSALTILVYCFTKTTVWKEHMDAQQKVFCNIMRAIEARGLSVAFPTRTLYLEGEVARKLAGFEPPLIPGDRAPPSEQ
jgi:MscS family membrane protein